MKVISLDIERPKAGVDLSDEMEVYRSQVLDRFRSIGRQLGVEGTEKWYELQATGPGDAKYSFSTTSKDLFLFLGALRTETQVAIGVLFVDAFVRLEAEEARMILPLPSRKIVRAMRFGNPTDRRKMHEFIVVPGN